MVWSGKIPPAVEQLSLCATTTEPMSHNYWAHVPWLLKPTHLEPCSATREATAMSSLCTSMKSSPHSPQLEKARVQQQRPNAAKNKLKEREIKNTKQKSPCPIPMDKHTWEEEPKRIDLTVTLWEQYSEDPGGVCVCVCLCVCARVCVRVWVCV